MAAGTTISLSKSANDKAIGKAITEFVAKTKEAKDAEKLACLAKDKIKAFAEERWLKLFDENGEQPEGPFKVINADGESVNYVVQDKSDGYALSDEQLSELEHVLGPFLSSDVAKSTRFEIDNKVLYENGCFGPPLVGELLAGAIMGLIQNRCITPDQGARLFLVKKVNELKPGFVKRLAFNTMRRGVQIKSILDAVGSAVVRYIK
jgi:hypothetical protein